MTFRFYPPKRVQIHKLFLPTDTCRPVTLPCDVYQGTHPIIAKCITKALQRQGCALRQLERSLVLWACEIQGTQHRVSMKKPRFVRHQRAKVRCQGPLGDARAQP